MYIVQIADMHMGAKEKASRDEEEIVRKSISKIKDIVPKHEEILICVCGDIIDSAEVGKNDHEEAERRYEKAATLLKLYVEALQENYVVVTKFCIGNHDVTHLPEFMKCVSKFDREITEIGIKEGYSYFCEKEDTYYLFLNSCFGDQYKVGRIDFKKLEDLIDSIPYETNKILVLHHTVMSMDEEDDASIRNAARLLGIVNNNNIVGILHGHVHGRDILSIGKNQCRLIGTGALFSRKNADVNSQFNVIHYQRGIFTRINNCRFIADNDSRRESWDTTNIGAINDENYFRGTSFAEVYRELLNKLEVVTPLQHLMLQIRCEYDKFKEELENFMKGEVLKIGERELNYLQLGEAWEAIEVPADLYFNHGQYFQIGGKPGIEEVARQLKNKPTGNRAVLSTYVEGKAKVSMNSDDEQKFLPSLLSIQFGKDSSGDVLYVHMNLRALEAERFLKINICEILYLLEQLKGEGIQFKTVDIVISAFRVQKKERFNCFLRAEIDKIDSADLTVKVVAGEISEICRMLEEKKDATETIINPEGIRNLQRAMEASNRSQKKEQNFYSKGIIEKTKEILNIYLELDRIHHVKSIHSSEEKVKERRIAAELENLIVAFRELEKKGEGE